MGNKAILKLGGASFKPTAALTGGGGTCLVLDCKRKCYSLRMCRPHYRSQTKYGDPFIGIRSSMPCLFWEKAALTADPNKCWLWQWSRREGGYGQFKFRGRMEYAHRTAWILTHGRGTSMVIRHICDTPACINPRHLIEGTQKENRQDAVGRNRQAKGEGQGCAKLNACSVRQIRRCAAKGQTDTAIARIFEVHRSTISDVRRGLTWGHIN